MIVLNYNSGIMYNDSIISKDIEFFYNSVQSNGSIITSCRVISQDIELHLKITSYL